MLTPWQTYYQINKDKYPLNKLTEQYRDFNEQMAAMSAGQAVRHHLDNLIMVLTDWSMFNMVWK